MKSIASASRDRIRLAAYCSGAMAATIMASGLFVNTLSRWSVFRSDSVWLTALASAAGVIGFLWFLFILAAARLGARDTVKELPDRDRHAGGGSNLGRSISIGVLAAFVLAVSASLALDVNDGFFYSRLLPWVTPLIWLQETGFRMASRLFPCQYEGFDTGCEWYKWLAVFILANAISYLPITLSAALLYRHVERMRSFAQRFAVAFLRWAAVLGVFLLSVRLILAGLFPQVASPLAAWSAGRIVWIALDFTSGAISVALALSFPFVLYRVVYAIWKRDHVPQHLGDLTWLAAFVSAALMLG